MQYTRKTILEQLQKKRTEKKPIVIAELGSGLAARVADHAGADAIVLSSRGLYRADGAAACGCELAYVDTNTVSQEQTKKILDHVKRTPVLIGIGVGDPYRDVDRFVDKMLDYGVSGVTNAPSTCQWENHFEGTGLVYETLCFPEEVRFLERCAKRGIFTLGSCFLPNQAEAMAGAGVDVISIEIGATDGGLLPSATGIALEAATEQVQNMAKIIRAGNPEAFVLFHGGPFAEPETIRYCLKNADVDGFYGGSAIERIPVEKAIFDTIERIAAPVE